MKSIDTIDTIATQLGIPVPFVVELWEAGIIEIQGDLVTETVVERVRISWNLHDELGVNLAGVEVALHLLGIIGRDRRTVHQRD